MLKQSTALLFALALSTQQELCFATGREVGLEGMGIYQETTCVRRLTDPDSLANPRLFRGLKSVYVYGSGVANDTNIDNSRSKFKLKQIGLRAVSRDVALKQGMPWIDFEVRTDSSGKVYNCVLTVSDVIKVERQPAEKYRLIWWCKHVKHDSPQEGFDKLIDLLIVDLRKFNNH